MTDDGAASTAESAASSANSARAPGDGASRQRALFMLLAIALLLPHGLAVSFQNDDAFISYRYAKNWVDGHGLVFNPGERVEGYTNFLWTILIGVFVKLGADPLVVSKVLGFLASAGTIVVTARLAAHVSRAAGAPREAPGELARGHRGLVDGVAPLLLAAWTPFAYWTFAGLEGPLFAFLLTLAVERAVAERVATAGARDASQRRGRGVALGAILALLALTRPEGVLFFAVFIAARLLAERRAGIVSAVRGQLPFLIAFAALYAPYFIWRASYYGYLLPNTFYVRQGRSLAENLPLYKNGLLYLLAFLKEGGGILLAAPLVLAMRRPIAWSLALPAAVLAVALLYLIPVGGDSKIHFRFFVPVLPLLCVFAEAALGTIVSGAERAAVRASSHRTRILAFAVVAVLALHLASPSFAPPDKYEIDKTFFAMLAEGGKWLARNAPEGSTVACFAVGALPYYAGLPCYDLLGVTDARIAHGPLEAGKMTGHGKTDWDYILEKRPTFIFPMEGIDLASAGYEYKPISVRVDDEVLMLRTWRLRH